MKQRFFIALLVLLAALVGFQAVAKDESGNESAYAPKDPSLAVATFAGGCFWCVEEGFEKIPGVVEAVSGYSGGEEANPTYEQVSSGSTGHTEAVQVYYDPNKITYEGLLQGFWRMMDPTDPDGQFVDQGKQYRPAIFYHNEAQKQLAQESKQALAASDRYENPVVIEVVPFEAFYDAEEYHQDYYSKNPVRYKIYTFNSGRYQFIDKVWGEDRKVDFAQYQPEPGAQGAAKASVEKAGSSKSDEGAAKTKSDQQEQAFMKPSEEQLKQSLTPEQFEVTQEDGTEPPFKNAYWDEKRDGIYVDIVSGEPLFSSRDKFESGTGWPSFTRPIDPDAVIEKEDRSWFGTRTEIRSAMADSHLGHVFNDGPAPTGLRYCMNSAALRFIPKAEMAEAGYGEYLDEVGGQS